MILIWYVLAFSWLYVASRLGGCFVCRSFAVLLRLVVARLLLGLFTGLPVVFVFAVVFVCVVLGYLVGFGVLSAFAVSCCLGLLACLFVCSFVLCLRWVAFIVGRLAGAFGLCKLVGTCALGFC